MALKTLTYKHSDLQKVSIYMDHYCGEPSNVRQAIGEEIYNQWMDLDRVLVRLWESNAIPTQIIYTTSRGKEAGHEYVRGLLPEMTKRGIGEVGKISGTCWKVLFPMTNDTPPTACLADFGFTTLSHAARGTMTFMAPELLASSNYGLTNSVPTQEADIYAFGLVLFQASPDGRPTVPKLQASGTRLGTRPEKPANAKDVGISNALWELMQVCWHRKIEERPQIQEVVEGVKNAAAKWRKEMPPSAPEQREESDEPQAPPAEDFEVVYSHLYQEHPPPSTTIPPKKPYSAIRSPLLLKPTAFAKRGCRVKTSVDSSWGNWDYSNLAESRVARCIRATSSHFTELEARMQPTGVARDPFAKAPQQFSKHIMKRSRYQRQVREHPEFTRIMHAVLSPLWPVSRFFRFINIIDLGSRRVWTLHKNDRAFISRPELEDAEWHIEDLFPNREVTILYRVEETRRNPWTRLGYTFDNHRVLGPARSSFELLSETEESSIGDRARRA
ncbi:hypothetical protein BJ322DRAFT_1017929 [Thelephora terrestris]|uniref:Protein kinase domain-containing protein n=1 Tax=Thelephora terrestris TaxID=56493 RepID=A0A9P6L9C1_9AGAM|nr:hypothetical protein BJ322DRAFT_1017929 [Thelephora terrestris]